MSKLHTVLFCFIALSIGTFFGLTAKQGSVVEYFAAGTLKGLNACVSNTASIALSDEEVRNVCSSRHGRNLNGLATLEGLGSPMEVEQGRFVFDGSITNVHQDYLVTFAQVSLTVFAEDGEETEHFAFGNVWATPFSEIEVTLPFARQLTGEIMRLEWCEHDIPPTSRKECKSWNISQVAGVKI